ncbi:hypothetical protein [Microbacterium sp.]
MSARIDTLARALHLDPEHRADRLDRRARRHRRSTFVPPRPAFGELR